MGSIIGWVAGGIGVAGALAVVVYWIKSAIDNKIALDERDAALKVEADRIAAADAAAADERARSAKELDGKVAAEHSVADAVAVLRGELSRAGGTDTTK